MAQPAYKYLEEFVGADPAPKPVELAARREMNSVVSQTAGAELEQAYARGLEEGQLRADAMVESEIARVAAEFDGRLADAKAEFPRELADRLVLELRHGLERLHATLSEQVLSVLLPVLRHALTDATIVALCEDLKQLAQGSEVVSIELSGPSELVEQLLCRYREIAGDPVGVQISFVRVDVGAPVEIKACADDRIIEARLSQWMSRIAEAVS